MTPHRPTASTAPTFYRLALLALVLAAFALRLHRLDAESLWYDEGVTAYVAGLNPVALTRWTAADIQPPLYYYIVAAWGRLTGWSEWALRAPSVFFGTLTVPLLAAVAARLFRRRPVALRRGSGPALLAALIATSHPFLIYYSQEARNYALLIALGISTAYCLLLIVGPSDVERRDERKVWVAYTLSATAALYTHYFAAFLLVALALIALIFTPRTWSPRRHLLRLFTSQLAIVLLYTPWLFVMLRQLGGDASYLPGPFRLGQALGQLATGALYGEMYGPWLLGTDFPLAAITFVALIALLWRNRPALLVTLLWVLVPTAGVLALAGVVPKFNVRYASLALPGLILLWSGGLSWPGSTTSAAPNGARRFTHYVLRTTQLLALLLLTICFLYAGRFWTADWFLTRSQWRETAAYIRDHRQPGDAVVLVSGHAWPVWDYYAPDIPALRLPDIDVLDVNQALGYTEAGEILRNGLGGANRVWLVQWQDEVLDPMGVVPLHLSQAGQEVWLNDARFWHIDLLRFDNVSPSAIEPEPPRNLNVNFGDELVLLGSEITQSNDLLLFWQLAPRVDALDADYHIVGEITRELEGFGQVPYARLDDRRPSVYDFPTLRWQPAQVIVGQIHLIDVMEGTLPGDYMLHLTLYNPDGDLAGLDVLDAAGNPSGKKAAIPLAIRRALFKSKNDGNRVDGQSVGGLSATIMSAPNEAEVGQTLRIEVVWSVAGPIGNTPQFVLRWLRDGTVLSEGEAEITGVNELLTPPPVNSEFREVRPLRPPLGLPPGEYEVEFARVDADGPSGMLWSLPITILPSTRIFDLPPLAQSLGTTFGDTIELAGLLEPLPNPITPNAPLSLTLAWCALDAPPADYSVTVQFLNEAGQPTAQTDAPLPGGSRNWLLDEVVTQSVDVVAPSEPGTYRVIAAVYAAEQPDFARLRTPANADFVELGIVRVRADAGE